MVKKMLLSIFLLGFASIALAGNYTLNYSAANEAHPAQSTFAGQYSGEWVARAADDEEHVGTWNISIASDGEVTGVEFDKTSGNKGTIKGFIDEDGFIKVFVKYSATVTIRGVLEKKGNRLTGTLKQTCSNGIVSANIDIILKRN